MFVLAIMLTVTVAAVFGTALLYHSSYEDEA
jgi:hypothetical protein